MLLPLPVFLSVPLPGGLPKDWLVLLKVYSWLFFSCDCCSLPPADNLVFNGHRVIKMNWVEWNWTLFASVQFAETLWTAGRQISQLFHFHLSKTSRMRPASSLSTFLTWSNRVALKQKTHLCWKSKEKKKNRALSIMQRSLRDLRTSEISKSYLSTTFVFSCLQVAVHQPWFQSFSHCQTVSSATAVVNLTDLYSLCGCFYRKLTESHTWNHHFLKIFKSVISAFSNIFELPSTCLPATLSVHVSRRKTLKEVRGSEGLFVILMLIKMFVLNCTHQRLFPVISISVQRYHTIRSQNNHKSQKYLYQPPPPKKKRERNRGRHESCEDLI